MTTVWWLQYAATPAPTTVATPATPWWRSQRAPANEAFQPSTGEPSIPAAATTAVTLEARDLETLESVPAPHHLWQSLSSLSWPVERRRRWVLDHSSRFAIGTATLNSINFVYMFVNTMVLVAAGGLSSHAVMYPLFTAHCLAHFCSVTRLAIKTFCVVESGIEVWWRSAATANFMVNVAQGGFLVMSWNMDWPHRGFLVSLVSLNLIYLMDFSDCTGRRRREQLEMQRRAQSRSLAATVKLTVFTLTDDMEEAQQQARNHPCHICLEDLQTGEWVGQLPCGHIFHKQCIKRWLTVPSAQSACPLRCSSCPATKAEAQVLGASTEVSSTHNEEIGPTVQTIQEVVNAPIAAEHSEPDLIMTEV
mmetsp:Transcript_52319/g.124878  ORF Transcript_52319/g.124878 Transcript_52319/m.124878 type:complete len:363 (-) Transcript_52319:73-1161(-)